MKVTELLAQLEKLPNKKFGQNFLVNEGVLQKIAAAGEIKKNETVVEIGPGLGGLTELLTSQAERVIAIEADRDLAEFLRRQNRET